MAKMNYVEWILYVILLVTVIAGVILGYTAPDFYTNKYVEEDGLIENATALFLFGGGVIMLRRLYSFKARAGTWFLLTTLLIALAFLFVAGEEISWGQRIFNIETSEFFANNNVQKEMNLHNLTINGVKINKLVFGKILTVMIILYLVVVSVVYRKSDRFKNLIDKLAVPIPNYHNATMYVIMAILVTIIPASRNSELLEFATSIIFFLILLNPYNNHIYQYNYYNQSSTIR